MMSPKYERLRMLHAALETAGHALSDPIDKLEVNGAEVLAWAGAKRIAMIWDYENDRDAQGRPMLGGGTWAVRIVGERASRSDQPFRKGLFSPRS
jgi:hypothetical protein